MKIETQRKNIVHRILEVQNAQLLNRIEELLDNETYTYTASGKPLSKKEYTNHLTEIMIASDAGERGYDTKSAREKIVRGRKLSFGQKAQFNPFKASMILFI